MANSDPTCSSRNQIDKGAFLPGSAGRRTELVAVLKNRDLVLDASYNPPLQTVAICTDNASRSVKGKSAHPGTNTSQSIAHSSWIQRLKPSSLRCIAKDVSSTFLKKDGFVCTHFTKDYSSCNRHLGNVSHHIRSSSWPPHGNQSKNLALEAHEPAYDHMEEYDDAAGSFHGRNHSNVFVSIKDSSQSSKVGFMSDSQQDCQEPFSDLDVSEPCARLMPSKKYTSRIGRHLGCNDDRDCKKLSAQFGQYYKDHLKDHKKSEFLARSEEVKSPRQLQRSENRGHLGGCSSTMSNDFVKTSALPLSGHEMGYSSGASADADVNYCHYKPIDFGIFDDTLSQQLGLGRPDFVKYPQLEQSRRNASRNTEKRDRSYQFAFPKKEAVQDGIFRWCNDEGDQKMAESMLDSNRCKEVNATAYLQNAMGTPHNLDLTWFNYTRADTYAGGETTIFGDGSGAVGTSEVKPQHIVSKRLDASCVRSSTFVNSKNPQFGEVGKTEGSPFFIKSAHEHAASTCIYDKSLGNYWNRRCSVLEELAHCNAGEMGHTQASLTREYDLPCNHNENVFEQPSRAKLTASDFVSYRRPDKLSNASKDVIFNDFNDKNLFPSKCLDPMITSRSHHVSNLKAPRLNAFPKGCTGFHEGATVREDSRPVNHHFVTYGMLLDDGYDPSRMPSIQHFPKVPNSEISQMKDSFGSLHDAGSLARYPLSYPSRMVINSEPIVKKSTAHNGWLQRWRSVERISCASRKPLALCNSQIVGPDQLSNCANTQCTIGSRLNDISSSKGNFADFGKGHNRSNRACETCHDSGSACVPGSLYAVQNFSLFRSNYHRPSIKAMAIVGSSTSIKRDGRFIRLPCTAEPSVLEYFPMSEDEKNIN